MNKKQLIKSLKKQNFPSYIIDAFEKVSRENFVPIKYEKLAYENKPLPLEEGSTISQPYTIAFMLMLLDSLENKKILEIGSGSGYVLALLSEISKKGKIFGIETSKDLVKKSKESLSNYENIEIIHGDGSKGFPDKAPFDRILVSAAFDKFPNHLLQQLKYNGILVVPVNNSIFYVKKEYGQNKIKEYPGFGFVPIK